MREYAQSALLAIASVKVAELLNFLPEPETLIQTAILALVSGFLGGAGRWCWNKAKSKIKI